MGFWQWVIVFIAAGDLGLWLYTHKKNESRGLILPFGLIVWMTALILGGFFK